MAARVRGSRGPIRDSSDEDGPAATIANPPVSNSCRICGLYGNGKMSPAHNSLSGHDFSAYIDLGHVADAAKAATPEGRGLRSP